MEYIHVKNYEKYQHYSDRNPPWIKLYIQLLDNVKFRKIKDRIKWQVVGLYLLASAHDNNIPNDPKYIVERLGLCQPLELQTIIDAGFITINRRRVTTMLAKRKRIASKALAK